MLDETDQPFPADLVEGSGHRLPITTVIFRTQ
jgi:hypothetical protein